MEWQRMHLADVAPKHFDFARGWSVLTVMAGISDMCHQCDKLPDIGKTKKALAQARRRTVSLKDPAPPSTTLAYDSPCLCQWLLRLGKPFYKDKDRPDDDQPRNGLLVHLVPPYDVAFGRDLYAQKPGIQAYLETGCDLRIPSREPASAPTAHAPHRPRQLLR